MKKHLAKVLSWMCLHTLALAVVLLLAVLAPVRVHGQLSACCAILSAGLGTINSTLVRALVQTRTESAMMD